MNAKSFLRQYEHARRRVQEIWLRLEDLEEQSTNVTQLMEGDRVQTSGNQDRLGEVVARKVDLQEELVKAETEALDIMNQVYSVVDQMQDPDRQQVIRLRYIKCQKWTDIADEMHYELRSVFYLHGHALEDVERIINK